MQKIEEVSTKMSRLKADELRNLIKQTVIDDVLDLGSRFSSSLAQETLI